MRLVPRRAHSPPFKGGVAAPLIKCRVASLAAQAGWFVNRSRSLLSKPHESREDQSSLKEKVSKDPS